MQYLNKSLTTINLHSKISWILLPAFVVLILVAAYAVNANRSLQEKVLPPGMVTISHQTLEETYGLRVNLVALTAASGMVDLRLKILDGDKARVLLGDQNNFPELRVNEKLTLHTSKDTATQAIDFTDNNNIFVLYPNAGSAVRPGDPVTIIFGDIALEPIIAK